ncbi:MULTISPECIES: hypothetical protein [Rhizobium]|uniref:hypothetical protein n=1 Tax=Rhizobium TaxID=379 RepID=UPI0014414B72|nr:hypothetical protein [Rhizobium leguminosarum]UFW80866.1 hypothetical protein RlegSU303_10995 [Rhizobium leguminosarum bv. viciae]
MTTAEQPKVSGWKGLSDTLHFERVKTALYRTRGRTRFDRAAADRILDDLRHVAYRNGLAAARVFQFVGQEYFDADEDCRRRRTTFTGCREICRSFARLRPLSKKLNPPGSPAKTRCPSPYRRYPPAVIP